MPLKSNTPSSGWEHFPHGADVGIRGFGSTLEQAFEQAAFALTGIVTDADIENRTSIEVECNAPDVEVLLVEWLNAIIYEMAVRNMIFGAFKVTLNDLHLRGTMWGEPIDQTKHAPACEPKGATYTSLRVAQDADGTWLAACIIDV
jgi:SHS2 domain-containing protein